MSGLRRAARSVAARIAVATGVTGIARSARFGSTKRVVILAYHDVAPRESEGRITPERFRRHIRYLKRSYTLCTLGGAVSALADPAGLERDLAVLTFDDGYGGNHTHAWPVLRAEEVPATIFVTTGFLDGEPLWFEVIRDAVARGGADVLRASLPGWAPSDGAEAALERLKSVPAAERDRIVEALRPLCDEAALARPLTWDQVRDMQAGGIEFGSHTVTHPILSSLPPDGQAEELRRSQERITEETGVRPRALAIPNGTVRDFDARTLALARDTGYDAVCTMVRGSNLAGADPIRLRRLGVGADDEALLGVRLSGLLDAPQG